MTCSNSFLLLNMDKKELRVQKFGRLKCLKILRILQTEMYPDIVEDNKLLCTIK